MNFEVEDIINAPMKLAFETYRDNLPEIAKTIPNIKKVEVVSREKKKDRIAFVNKWFGKGEELAWLDKAEWFESEWKCTWEMEPLFFKDYVVAKGVNYYHPEGKDKTKIVLTGELSIDVSKHPAVPRLFARVINPQMEKFFMMMIKPNLIQGNRALERFISGMKKK
jgi:hypothetical protein